MHSLGPDKESYAIIFFNSVPYKCIKVRSVDLPF
jgi:hypothetical protein